MKKSQTSHLDNVAKNAARDLANEIGGKTIGMTRLGEYLESINASDSLWRAALANFANVANNASRAIYCVQNSLGVGVKSVWATVEYGFVCARDVIYRIVS